MTIEVGQKYRLNNVAKLALYPEFNSGDIVIIIKTTEFGSGLFWDKNEDMLWGLSDEDVSLGYATLITEDETNPRPSTDLEKFLIREIFFLLVDQTVEFKDGDFGAMMIDTFSDEMKAEVVVNYLNMIKEQNE